MKNKPSISVIEKKIFIIRGQRVMLDRDLAELYGIPLKRLNEQVKRNRDRFPDDFMVQLSMGEAKSTLILRSQIATLRLEHGRHTKYAPHVFTEYGALMLANIIKSPRAIQTSIYIVRAFVELRRAALEGKNQPTALEQRLETHDVAIKTILEMLSELIKPVMPETPIQKERPFGFSVSRKK
jgi:hypothetical protein